MRILVDLIDTELGHPFGVDKFTLYQAEVGNHLLEPWACSHGLEVFLDALRHRFVAVAVIGRNLQRLGHVVVFELPHSE